MELILMGWKIVPNEEHVQCDHSFASQPLANEPLHSSQLFDTSLQKARGTISLCGPWAALHFLASLASKGGQPCTFTKVQMAPRLKILMFSGSKKGALFSQKFPASESHPGSPTRLLWREIPSYRAFLHTSWYISLSQRPKEESVPPYSPKAYLTLLLINVITTARQRPDTRTPRIKGQPHTGFCKLHVKRK